MFLFVLFCFPWLAWNYVAEGNLELLILPSAAIMGAYVLGSQHFLTSTSKTKANQPEKVTGDSKYPPPGVQDHPGLCQYGVLAV